MPNGNYQQEIESLSIEAVDGKINKDEFISRIKKLIAAYYLIMFLLGSGLREDDMTASDTISLAGKIAIANDSAEKLGDDIYSGKYSGQEGKLSLSGRISLWVEALLSVFIYGKLFNRNDPFLRWIWDPQKDHCIDCMRLNGQVHRSSQWKASGYFPKSFDLECRGFYCGCKFVTDNGPEAGMF